MSKDVTKGSSWARARALGSGALLAIGFAWSCSAYDPELVTNTRGSQTTKPRTRATASCSLCRLGESEGGSSGQNSGARAIGAHGTGGAAAATGGGSSSTPLANDAGPSTANGHAVQCLPLGTDCCPNDPLKTAPGPCGCGVAETDSDRDGVSDCIDPAPYGWRRCLTIDGSQVAGPLTHFPLAVRITDAHLQAAAAGDGSDIHFTAADEQQLLDHEIESYESSTGTLVAWVRLPSVNPGEDLVFCLAYGDGKPDRSYVAGVWAAYEYVWHMSESPESTGTATIRDSAGHANGIAKGDMTADNSIPAIAGQGLAFDGIDDQIMFSNRLSGNGESTIGAWVKQLPDATGLADVVIAFGDHRQNAARVLASFEPSSGRCKVGFANNDLRGGALAMGVWTHLVWVWDEATYSSIYIDGRRVEGPTRHLGANTFGNAGRIGNATIGSADYFLFGALDEVRVAPVAHSSAWVLTEYNSQRPGSTFIKSIEVARPDDDH